MSKFHHLLPPTFKEEVLRWVHDDCPSFDVGGFVVGDDIQVANLYCKEDSVLAGVPFANAIFEALSLQVFWNVEEGETISMPISEEKKGKVVVAVVEGKVRNLLLAERTCLNILSRASGIATAARRALAIKEEHQWHGYVAGTRKTTPGFRTVEKYALIVGGVATHRLDLSQMVMLKDNHIWSCGNITKAVHTARQAAGFSSKIEVFGTLKYSLFVLI
jgi:nicotinate-nucleotide pyrophosphorylase (carboxylating)